MQADFWHEKWEAQQIGFHQDNGNPLLIKYFSALGLETGSRVFVPLCGKTRDIAWLLAQGCRVVGAELSEIAVQQLFEELEVTPKVSTVGPLTLYAADGVDVFVGDVFALTAGTLGAVDAVFDRAALVALPDEMRTRYADHLVDVTGAAPQLLITFTYDQALMSGPPFSILGSEIQSLYSQSYLIERLEIQMIEGGFKGAIPAREVVWILKSC